MNCNCSEENNPRHFCDSAAYMIRNPYLLPLIVIVGPEIPRVQGVRCRAVNLIVDGILQQSAIATRVAEPGKPPRKMRIQRVTN